MEWTTANSLPVNQPDVNLWVSYFLDDITTIFKFQKAAICWRLKKTKDRAITDPAFINHLIFRKVP
jgi:hypothetical protein